MHLPHPARLLLGTCLRVCAVGCVLLAHLVSAQSTPTGSIEGRILNVRSGEYLERARVTVAGTLLETFTDSAGQYRLDRIPAGPAQVHVFFTGLDPTTATVAVAAGQTAQRDFSLSFSPTSAASPPSINDTTPIRLSEFSVTASREMNGAAIAINEQRFAPNFKTVVAADEMGTVPEGNLGEFMKFLPGVTVDYGGGEARVISLNGAPSGNVPISVGGFALASAASSGTGRSVELEQVSINNIARIEVAFSPTPEISGAALAGSVNLVPRYAFERVRPEFTANAFVILRDHERHLGKTSGPRATPTAKIHPGFEFSYLAPVNKKFGFTISGATSKVFTLQDFIQNTWRGASGATNGGTLPTTTPDKPYLTDFGVQQTSKESTRSSLGATVDYQPTRRDSLSLSFQYAYFLADFAGRGIQFFVNSVAAGNFSTDFTHGAVGAGEIRNNNGARQKSGTTCMPTLVWRHNGPVWKSELGAGYSRASNHYRDIDQGFFNGLTVTRRNVTVSFDKNFYLRPGQITVNDGTTGAPVDYTRLNNFVLTNVSSNQQDGLDVQRSAYASLRRDFLWRVPVSLKVGTDLRNSLRDVVARQPSRNFVGADGLASTTPTAANSDDNAIVTLDESLSQRTFGYGIPQMQVPGGEAAWALYQAHPNYFVPAGVNNDYNAIVNNSKFAEESIYAAYVRGDTSFFRSRLKLVGGVRAEQTNVHAEGPLTDATRNFQRDANGKALFAANATTPLLIEPAGTLAAQQRTLVLRGQRVDKEYLRYFPSLNASYNVRDNLIARGAYYWSVGRPDFNQYAGGLTLPNTEIAPSASNRITVNNAGIKAWKARTTKFSLEHYFEGVGLISVGAYRRDLENFFGGTTFNATPEFLALYGLDPAIYSPFLVSTQMNVGSVRMTGLEFSYKQSLTFLPAWARGVQVFANGSAQRATGPGLDSFTNSLITPRSGNWGVSLTRPRYRLLVAWNYRGIVRQSLVTGTGIEPGTYNWQAKRLYVDVTGEYTFSKRFSAYANLRNLNDTSVDNKVFGPSTPAVANFRNREKYGAEWTFGIKGRF